MKRKLLSFMLVLALVVSLVPAAGAKALTGDQEEAKKDWGKIVRDISTKTVEGYECVTITDKYSKKGLITCQWTEHRLLTITLKKGESIYVDDLFCMLDYEVQKLYSNGIYSTTTGNNIYNPEGLGDLKYLDLSEDSKGHTIATGKKAGFETFVDSMQYYIPSAGISVCPTVKVVVTDRKNGQLYADEENYLQFVDGGKGKKVKLADASGKVTYKSSNKKVFKVSKKGNITPVAPGYATLTAKAGNKTYTATVCVISKGLEYSYDIRNSDGRPSVSYTIPAVVKGIGKCKDKKIVIGRYAEDNAHMIFGLYKDAFNDTGITDIALPDTLRELNTSFVGTKIKKLDIPAKVTKFGGTTDVRKAECIDIAYDLAGLGSKSGTMYNYLDKGILPEVSGCFAFNIKDVTINSLETLQALCSLSAGVSHDTLTYHYDGKDFITYRYLPSCLPMILGYVDDGNERPGIYTALKAVDFNPEKDSYNARVLKADLILMSVLSQVHYDAKYADGNASRGEILSPTVSHILLQAEGEPIKRFACDQYSNATSKIYRAFGLPVSGTGGSLNGESHAWTVALLSDGRYYNVDNVGLDHGLVFPHFDEAVKEVGVDNIRKYLKNIEAYGGNIGSLSHADKYTDEGLIKSLRNEIGDCDIEFYEIQRDYLREETGLDYKTWLSVTEKDSKY